MTEGGGGGAVWDPIDSIWEYVLNDYDQEKEEEGPAERPTERQPKKSRSWNKRRQKGKESEQEKDLARSQSILDFFTEDSRGDDESPRLNQHQRSRSGNSRSRSRKGREIEEEQATIVDSTSWVSFDFDGIEGREPNESTTSSTTTPRRHPWRRHKPSTEETFVDDNSAGSYWDLVMDPLDVNPKSQSNASSKNLNAGTKKKYSSSKNRDNNTGSSRELIKRDSSFKASGKKAKNQTKDERQSSKRLGFFKRSFRKHGNANNVDMKNSASGSTRSLGSRNQQGTSTSKSRSHQLLSKSTSQSQSVDQAKLRQDGNKNISDDFSPFSMLMEVAEKVASYASDDSDSDCSSPSAASTPDNTQQSDTTDEDDNSTITDRDTSTITEKTPISQDNFTEVRLFHQPHDDDDAKEKPDHIGDESQLENKLYQGYDRLKELPAAIPDSRASRPSWGRSFVPIRLQRSRGSLASWASHQKVDDFLDDARDHREDVDTDDTSGGDSMNVMSIPEYEPRDYSQDFFYHQAPNNRHRDGREPSQLTDVSDFHEKKGLKRLVCCSVKNKGFDASTLLQAQNDMKQVLPRTRMISDENTEQAKLVSTSNANVDEIMGVNTDTILETKGPQSLYNYDYGKKEHVDVVYEDFSADPRKSMFTRRYDLDPAKLNSIGDKIVVQIEASTVSETDCVIRRGEWWRPENVPLPVTPGVDMVGKVYHVQRGAMAKYDLKPCQTVISLVKWGGNSRFMTVCPSRVVHVPDKVDPAQAACLPETYLAAFQVLHFGQLGALRYRTNSLKGKTVLILGAMANNMGRAIIELALNAGAGSIYATAKKKHWQKLISFGVMPLSPDPAEWINRLEETADLVLATNGGMREDVSPIHFRCLSESGHLILCGKRVVGNDAPVGQWKAPHSPSLKCSRNKAETKILNQSHSYDVFEQWEKDIETCKKDLSHLLNLLERGILKPNVLDRIALGKVSRAHELIEAKRLSGFLVCEPWLRSKKRAVYL